jgi:hypothetical protein
VPNLNLGNLSRNGHYDRVVIPSTRTLRASRGVTQYTLRGVDWNPAPRRLAAVRSSRIPQSRDVVSNLYNPIRVEIQNEAGEVVALPCRRHSLDRSASHQNLQRARDGPLLHSRHLSRDTPSRHQHAASRRGKPPPAR